MIVANSTGREDIDAIRPARDFYDAVFFLRRPGPGGDAGRL